MCQHILRAGLLTSPLQKTVLYIPWLNPIFKTGPLAVDELALCMALSCVVFAGVEIEKMLIRRGWIYANRP